MLVEAVAEFRHDRYINALKTMLMGLGLYMPLLETTILNVACLLFTNEQ